MFFRSCSNVGGYGSNEWICPKSFGTPGLSPYELMSMRVKPPTFAPMSMTRICLPCAIEAPYPVFPPDDHCAQSDTKAPTTSSLLLYSLPLALE